MSTHEELVAEVVRLDGEVQRWESRAVELDAEAEHVDATAGDALLDDPDTAETLGTRLGALRDQASMSRRAAVKAAERAVAARRAVAEQEVGPLLVVEEQAQSALAEHRAKADRLLRQLKDFTGADFRLVTLATLQHEFRAAASGERLVYHPSVAERLGARVVQARRRREAMEAAARGEDPLSAVEGGLAWTDLGDCLRTDGVLDTGIGDPDARGSAA